jgi:PRTRC genetic system protein B
MVIDMICTQVGGVGGSLRLEHAILLYSGRTEGGRDGLVTINPVRIVGDDAVIAPGQPASKAALVHALDHLADRSSSRSLIHPRVLGKGPDYLVWYTPPGIRHVAFRHTSFGGEKAASCPLPGLVFMVRSEGWYVFAYAGKRRPTEKTRLLRSPFFNVWEAGRICVGNIDLPKQRVGAPVEQWEDAFFGTWFTHPNVPQDQLLKKGANPFSLWKELMRGKHQAFPSSILKPAGATLGEMFEKLIGGDE